VGVHWQYDLDQLEKDRGFVTGYLDPLPGSFHSGTSDAPGKGRLKAGQLEQQGEVTKLLLQSLASKGCLDQADFHDRFEKEILREDTMDGTRQGGKYGWTDKTICDFYKARVVHNKPWAECVLPRSDTPDTIVRGALIASSYFLSPRAMCCQVQAHSKAFTGDSSVQAHSVAFAVLLAGIIQGLPLDKGLSWRMYTQAGDPLPFSSVHSDKDHDEDYGDYTEPDSLLWYGMLAEGVQNCAQGIEPPHRGVELYGKFCAFYGVLGSAYYCAARYPDDFEKAVLCSLNGGGQNTMRTSLVGAFLGAHVGLKGIPQKLIDGLDDHDNIVALAMQVAQHAIDRSSPLDAWKWPSDEPCFSKTVQAFLREKSGRNDESIANGAARWGDLFAQASGVLWSPGLHRLLEGIMAEREEVVDAEELSIPPASKVAKGRGKAAEPEDDPQDEKTTSTMPNIKANELHARYFDQRGEDMDAWKQLSNNLAHFADPRKNGTLDHRALKEGISKLREEVAKEKDNSQRANVFYKLSFLCFALSISEAMAKEAAEGQRKVREGLNRYVYVNSKLDRSKDVELISIAFVRTSTQKNSKLRLDMNRIANGARVMPYEEEAKTLVLEIQDVILQEVKAAFDKETLIKEAKATVKEEVKAEVEGVLKASMSEETLDTLQQVKDIKESVDSAPKTKDLGKKVAEVATEKVKDAVKEELITSLSKEDRAALAALREIKEVNDLVKGIASSFLGSEDESTSRLRQQMEKLCKPAISTASSSSSSSSSSDPVSLMAKLRKEIREKVREEVQTKLDELKQEIKDSIKEALSRDGPTEAAEAKAKAEAAQEGPSKPQKDLKEVNESKVAEGQSKAVQEAEAAGEAVAEEVGKEGVVAVSEAIGSGEAVGITGGVDELLAHAMAETDVLLCAGEALYGVLGSAYYCAARYPDDFEKDHVNIVALAMQVAQHAIDRSSPSDAWKWPSDENRAFLREKSGRNVRCEWTAARMDCSFYLVTKAFGAFSAMLLDSLLAPAAVAPLAHAARSVEVSPDQDLRTRALQMVLLAGAICSHKHLVCFGALALLFALLAPVRYAICGCWWYLVVFYNGEGCWYFSILVFWALTMTVRKLDSIWFTLVSAVALAIVFWRPAGIVGTNRRSREGKHKPIPWYNVLFAALSSHAAGIVGFVGFQKTVVARIVSCSHPQTPWTWSGLLADCLLYASLATSIIAILASLVFLGVDYMRRLAMDSGRSSGLRLVLEPGRIEKTGLGVLLIILTALLLVLYLSVIVVEASKKDSRVDRLLLCERVFSGTTVLLYLLNLRSLCESPKDFLVLCCGDNEEGRSNGLRKFLADGLGYIAGQDGWKCRCRDRFAGSIYWRGGEECECSDGFAGNIVWEGQTLQGTCQPAPCNIQNSTRDPGLACKCRSGFEGSVEWSGATPKGSCQPVPCRVVNSNKAPGDKCRCEDGFAGAIIWSGTLAKGSCNPAPCNIANSSGQGLNCRCEHGLDGVIHWNGSEASGRCAPAPCNITNSNRMPGHGCKCKDGYGGTIHWELSTAKGTCKPATCKIKNSNRANGPKCRCLDGYAGSIIWQGSAPLGSCEPAFCNKIANTNGKRGTACACGDGFVGNISWQGPGCRCLDGFGGIIAWNGHRCGYDLISWDTASIIVLSKTCTYKLSGQNGKKTWQSDGVYLSLQKKFASERMRWGFRRYSDEPEDEGDLDELDENVGFHFFDRTTDELRAKWKTLPSWWGFKFQQISSRASFNADRLVGCEKSFSHQDACYKIVFGQEIWTTTNNKSYCDFGQVAKPVWRKYVYSYSAFGVQMYRSKTPCLPIAAYEEIQVTVTDVNLPEEEFAYAAADAPCRRTIGLATAARALDPKCQNAYEVVYTNGRNVGAALDTFNFFDDEDEDDDAEDEDGLD
ncbi:FP2, partial [Symbiodinium sp. KB8]